MKAFIACLLGIPTIIFGGYVLSVLWNWYVVSALGLGTLSVKQAIGLGCFTSIFYTRSVVESTLEKYIPEEHQDICRPIVTFIYYTITWGVGAAYSLFLS